MTVHITVDRDRCENHGACALVAPDAFRMDDDGVLQHADEVGDDRGDDVEEAADLCPVQAILVTRG